MNQKVRSTSRRSFLGQAAGATVVVATSGLVAGPPAAAESHLPKVDPDEPQAKALGYVHESTTEGQRCDNCQFFKGAAAWGECQIFPGKLVNAQGWCKSWIKAG